ncbi:hypothetical protein ACK34V_19235 [Aeromonas veronii]|uniref:hypothetical protein n=1 Tax=Aeromonas TaxID=642 RepID=UPI000D0FEFB1|nr:MULTISPECIES: hypothetical protein [Aeromonas]MCH7371026.1 hypothetical protein [Aeromonas sp. MR16]PSJ88017.1 hypothetical protein CT153_11990 [Aeromonas veronii]
MNDPMLLANRLKELAKLAEQANTAFEKAAVYAATRSIQAEFDAAEEDFDSYTLEKVLYACTHICAAVGYDITNGHDSSQHIVWALGSISSLKTQLKSCPEA